MIDPFSRNLDAIQPRTSHDNFAPTPGVYPLANGLRKARPRRASCQRSRGAPWAHRARGRAERGEQRIGAVPGLEVRPSDVNMRYNSDLGHFVFLVPSSTTENGLRTLEPMRRVGRLRRPTRANLQSHLFCPRKASLTTQECPF